MSSCNVYHISFDPFWVIHFQQQTHCYISLWEMWVLSWEEWAKGNEFVVYLTPIIWCQSELAKRYNPEKMPSCTFCAGGHHSWLTGTFLCFHCGQFHRERCQNLVEKFTFTSVKKTTQTLHQPYLGIQFQSQINVIV